MLSKWSKVIFEEMHTSLLQLVDVWTNYKRNYNNQMKSQFLKGSRSNEVISQKMTKTWPNCIQPVDYQRYRMRKLIRILFKHLQDEKCKQSIEGWWNSLILVMCFASSRKLNNSCLKAKKQAPLRPIELIEFT